MLLQPNIEHDEQVAASHLLDLQLGAPCFTIHPIDRDYSERVPSYDCFEWHLDSEVKVGGNEWLDPFYDMLSIELKGVSKIIKRHAEKDLDEQIGQPIQQQLMRRVVNYFAPLDEARPKNTLKAFLEFPVAAYQVVWAVGSVCHHHRNSVTVSRSQAAGDSSSEAVKLILDHSDFRDFSVQPSDDIKGLVLTTIIHNDNFEVYTVASKRSNEISNRGLDAPFLIPGGDNDG